jgi:hypothetical protein
MYNNYTWTGLFYSNCAQIASINFIHETLADNESYQLHSLHWCFMPLGLAYGEHRQLIKQWAMRPVIDYPSKPPKHILMLDVHGVWISLIDIHSECRLLCVQHWSTTTNCYLWLVGPCLPLQDLPFLHHVACVQVACSRVPAIEGEAHPMTKEDSPKDATSWSRLIHQSLITIWDLLNEQ